MALVGVALLAAATSGRSAQLAYEDWRPQPVGRCGRHCFTIVLGGRAEHPWLRSGVAVVALGISVGTGYLAARLLGARRARRRPSAR